MLTLFPEDKFLKGMCQLFFKSRFRNDKAATYRSFNNQALDWECDGLQSVGGWRKQLRYPFMGSLPKDGNRQRGDPTSQNLSSSFNDAEVKPLRVVEEKIPEVGSNKQQSKGFLLAYLKKFEEEIGAPERTIEELV